MARTPFTLCLIVAFTFTLAVAGEARVQKTALSETIGTEPPTAAPSIPAVPVVVTNFPATQNVDGTVNVGNLPTDQSGNVRVSSSPFSQVVTLLEGDVPLSAPWESPVFDTSEFSKMFMRHSVSNGYWWCEVLFQWAEGEDFVSVAFLQDSFVNQVEVYGPRAKIRCGPYTPGTPILSNVRVFLRKQ